MFAVINTGGKQYVVSKGTVIKTEKIQGNEGDSIDFPVILASDEEGKTLADGKKVLAKAVILSQMKDKKIIIFKKKRRKNYRRKNGHRQNVTVLRIVDVLAS